MEKLKQGVWCSGALAKQKKVDFLNPIDKNFEETIMSALIY